jgi:hypothetical protein
MDKSEAYQISNKIVEVSRINIFDNTRDRDYVYYRSLLAYVLKNKLNMGWTNIAKFFKANGKQMDHSNVIHLVKQYPHYRKYNSKLLRLEKCFFEADNIYRLQEEIRKLNNEKQALKTTVKFLEEKIKLDPVLDLFFDIPNDKFKDVIERLNLLKKSWAWKNEDKCQIIEGSVW